METGHDTALGGNELGELEVIGSVSGCFLTSLASSPSDLRVTSENRHGDVS